MGETYSLLAPFFVDEIRDEAAFVRRSVAILRANGFETVSDDGGQTVESYEIDGDPRSDAALEAVAVEIADAGSGDVSVWLEEFHARARFSFDRESADEVVPSLALTSLDEYAFDEDDVPRETALSRADHLVDAIAALAVETDPWLVGAGMYLSYAFPTLGSYPQGRPPESGIERLAWVTVFGEGFHDRFGGRERLLEAPAWNVRALENGAVLVRQRDMPHGVRSDTDRGPEPSTYEYLFDRKSIADLRAEIDRQRRTYVDPFHDLEEGELASDVLICEGHAPFEVEAIDYAAFPAPREMGEWCHVLCVRRDGDALWEANNGEFVRRLVDADGRPIGDLPDGVPFHQEMISKVVTTEHAGGRELDMYRMERPDEPSLAAQLYGLDRLVDGESIWQDRDEPVTQD